MSIAAMAYSLVGGTTAFCFTSPHRYVFQFILLAFITASLSFSSGYGYLPPDYVFTLNRYFLPIKRFYEGLYARGFAVITA
jgi:hypothetical protein